MQRRIIRVGLLLTPNEKKLLIQLAESEGLSEAATLRWLLRQAMKQVPADPAPAQAESELAEVQREAQSV